MATTYEAKCEGGSDTDDLERQGDREKVQSMSKGSKRLSRMGLEKMDWRRGKHAEGERAGSRISVQEVKWER